MSAHKSALLITTNEDKFGRKELNIYTQEMTETIGEKKMTNNAVAFRNRVNLFEPQTSIPFMEQLSGLIDEFGESGATLGVAWMPHGEEESSGFTMVLMFFDLTAVSVVAKKDGQIHMIAIEKELVKQEFIGKVLTDMCIRSREKIESGDRTGMEEVYRTEL